MPNIIKSFVCPVPPVRAPQVQVGQLDEVRAFTIRDAEHLLDSRTRRQSAPQGSIRVSPDYPVRLITQRPSKQLLFVIEFSGKGVLAPGNDDAAELLIERPHVLRRRIIVDDDLI